MSLPDGVVQALEEVISATVAQHESRQALDSARTRQTCADGNFRRAVERVDEANKNLGKLIQATCDPALTGK